jgi:hypothetical protein
MPRVPTNVSDLLSFASEHYNTWQGTPASVGLSAGQITSLKGAKDDAIAAVAAQAAAKDGSKASTLTANTKVSNLRKNIAACIRSIVTFADAAADPMAIFALAQIDPTSPPTPSQPPGTPSNITATLDNEGNVTLKWKCINPPGGNVVYSVMRRDDSSGDLTQIGVIGPRMFTDDSIPAGSASVQYQIRAFRGQMAGPSSPVFLLRFGHGGGGAGLASESMPAMKIAA